MSLNAVLLYEGIVGKKSRLEGSKEAPLPSVTDIRGAETSEFFSSRSIRSRTDEDK